MLSNLFVVVAAGLVSAAMVEKRQAGVPDYLQTSPEIFAGPTPTGKPAFLAQTNPAPFAGQTYIPPQPIETQVPIRDSPGGENGNIFHLHGQLSHYFPNPIGFGVDEYPIPKGANITQHHMLSRHGARYPTATSKFVQKIANNTGKFKASGQLAFLNSWTNKLGEAIMTPLGNQELFDSGVLHQYLYGHLYPNDGTKLIARTTTQDRMRKSAEYFLSGFFGLNWPENATLVNIIEQNDFNNSLAGYFQCPNSNNFRSQAGNNATTYWSKIYLADATKRLSALIQPAGFLNVSDVYDMQSLCAYETVALGYSAFCSLFNYKEWQGYEYSVDLNFAGNSGFSSPTGRAVGAGWVAELRARLMRHYINAPTAQVNVTLDSMPSTFPLNQNLYFDFSHDTNIFSILTALGLKQFAGTLPNDTIPADREVFVSHLTPFGARLDIEIITAPGRIPERRPRPYAAASDGSQAQLAGDDFAYSDRRRTQYIHMLLNQRTIPLGRSYRGCGNRDDGYCELGDFLDATKDCLELSQYGYACFGNYSAAAYGSITNGAPLRRRRTKRSLQHSKRETEVKAEDELDALKPALLL